MKRSGNAVRLVASLAIAALATLAVAEFGVRWLLPQPRGFSWLTEQGLQVHVPHRDAVYQRAEFAARVRFNALGFRGREVEIPKPAGRLRVLALGDSFVEGMQVDEDALFTSRIERSMDAVGRPLEVVNLGVSGYGTDDALDVLRSYGPRIEPDLVLLFFCVANDFENNLFEDRCSIEGDGVRCAAPVAPTARQLRFAHAKSWFSTHSQLYQALQASATDPFWQRIGLRAPIAPSIAAVNPFARELFVAPPSERVAAAIALSRGLVEALRDEARLLGAPLWLVVLPTREQVEDEAWAHFAGDAPSAVRDAPQRALAEIAASLAIPMVDPLPAFRARDQRGDRLFWRIDAHFNETGHEVAAQVVTQALEARAGEAL